MARHFKSLTLLLILATIFISQQRANAGLTWQEMSKSLDADVGGEKAIVTFGFRNDGAGAVQILHVTPSCNCLTASSSVQSLATGGTGEITVVFHPKLDRTEIRHDWVAVLSQDGADKKTELLRLTIRCTPLITFDPPSLVWAKGAAASPITVNVIPAHPEQGPLSIIKINGGQAFKTTSQPGAMGFTVTPAATDKPVNGHIRLTVRKMDQSTVEVTIPAEVNP